MIKKNALRELQRKVLVAKFQEHVLNYVHNSQYFGIIRMYRKRDIMQLIIYHMYRAKVNSLLQLKNQFPVDVFNSFVARLRQENPQHVDERSSDEHLSLMYLKESVACGSCLPTTFSKAAHNSSSCKISRSTASVISLAMSSYPSRIAIVAAVSP